MVAYLKYAPAGIPGDITRKDVTTVEPIMLANPAPQSYGVPVKVVNGLAAPYDGSENAASLYGVLARSVPGQSNTSADDSSFTAYTPNVKQPQDTAVKGYLNVLCTAGTPARGGNVYIRTAAASGRPIGAFEAVSDGGNSFLQPDLTWASQGKDANNNAELSIRNIINAA